MRTYLFLNHRTKTYTFWIGLLPIFLSLGCKFTNPLSDFQKNQQETNTGNTGQSASTPRLEHDTAAYLDGHGTLPHQGTNIVTPSGNTNAGENDRPQAYFGGQIVNSLRGVQAKEEGTTCPLKWHPPAEALKIKDEFFPQYIPNSYQPELPVLTTETTRIKDEFSPQSISINSGKPELTEPQPNYIPVISSNQAILSLQQLNSKPGPKYANEIRCFPIPVFQPTISSSRPTNNKTKSLHSSGTNQLGNSDSHKKKRTDTPQIRQKNNSATNTLNTLPYPVIPTGNVPSVRPSGTATNGNDLIQPAYLQRSMPIHLNQPAYPQRWVPIQLGPPTYPMPVVRNLAQSSYGGVQYGGAFLQLGQRHYSPWQYNEALQSLGQTLTIQQNAWGKEHPDLEPTYQDMAQSLKAQGKYDEALECLRHILTIRKNKLGERNSALVATYQDMARLLDIQEKYDEALECLRHVLAIQQHTQVEKHPDRVLTYQLMAQSLKAQGKYDETLECLRKVLAIQQHRLRETYSNLATTHRLMAQSLEAQGKYDEARECSDHVSAIERHTRVEKRPDVTPIYNNMVQSLEAPEKHDKALQSLRQDLTVQQNTLREKYSNLATTYQHISEVLQHQRKYIKALDPLRQAVAIQQNMLGEEHPDLVRIYRNIARVLRKQLNDQQYEEAFKYLCQAVAIQQNMRDGEHLDLTLAVTYRDTGQALEARGLYYADINQLEKIRRLYDRNMDWGKKVQRLYNLALQYFDKAINIYYRTSNKTHLDLAHIYRKKARVLRRLTRYDEALENLSWATNIYLVTLDSNHPDVAGTARDIIHVLLQGQKQYDKALQHSDELLTTYYEQLRGDHADVALIYENIRRLLRTISVDATGYESEEFITKALEYYRQVLVKYKQELGGNHIKVANIYWRMAEMIRFTSKGIKGMDLALDYYQCALAIYQNQQAPINRFLVLICNSMAGLLINKGCSEKALQYCDRALGILQKCYIDDNARWRAFYYKGLIKFGTSRYDEAINCFKEALPIIEKDPVKLRWIAADTYYHIGGAIYFKIENNEIEKNKIENNYGEALKFLGSALKICSEEDAYKPSSSVKKLDKEDPSTMPSQSDLRHRAKTLADAIKCANNANIRKILL